MGFCEVCINAYKATYSILLNKACLGCCCFLRKKGAEKIEAADGPD